MEVKNMKILMAATVAVLLMAGTVHAGDAGCGLGSIVIQKNSKLLQLFASTTNATFLSQPLGITFGTSGCSASGIVQNDKQIDYFVEVNQEDLTREMAQGQGEKLSTLAALHGCQTPEAQLVFSQMTQASFVKILPSDSTSANEMIQNLKKELKDSPNVEHACTGATTAATVSSL